MTGPKRALQLLKDGGLKMGPAWAEAHEICQTDEGERDHDLVHALCHWIEGDVPNRNYWYARVEPWQRAATLEEEWQAVWLAVT